MTPAYQRLGIFGEAEGARHIPPSFGSRKPDLRPCRPAAQQKPRRIGKPRKLPEQPRDFRRLIEAPKEKPPAMQWNRHDHIGVRQNVGPDPREPARENGGCLHSIAIFETMNEPRRAIAIPHDSPRTGIDRRIGERRSADGPLACIKGKGDARHRAPGPLYKIDLRPAGAAKRGVIGNSAPAAKTKGRQHEIGEARRPCPHPVSPMRKRPRFHQSPAPNPQKPTREGFSCASPLRQTDPPTMMRAMPGSDTRMRPFDRVTHRRRRDRAAAGFGQYDFLVARAAEDIADRIAAANRSFDMAVDLGAHNGALARALADAHLPPEKLGTLISADISLPMLHQAAGLRVAADEEALPFANQSLNLVTSVLSLHWVNDLPGALVQIRRALKPDGLFMAAIFGGETLTELRQSLAEAEIEQEGGLSPRVAPFADLRDIGALLQRAGFALPVADTDRVTVRYTDALRLMADLRGMGETNAMSERRRTPLRRSTLMRAAEIYHEKFALEDGRIPATFDIVIATGWAPHESQQQPLRPGSAQARLADALGTKEHPTGEKPGR
jgi:NADH dehydrogenase [ubiquinone] 1 alpha subcomplex assembly factor 5